jgi:hypothetical protein
MRGPRLPVSVIVPALNRAALLPRCLGGVASQRPYLPLEVIVVDDGSGDATACVAAQLGAKVIRHPHNRGLAAARNSGLEAATCDWAAFLDSDDEWLPDHLAHLWQLRDDHALVGSSVLYCGQDLSRDRFQGPVARKPLVIDCAARIIAPYNVFSVSACMIRRDVAIELGGFRPLWGVEDFDLWVRVLERQTAICSPHVTAIYHLHDGQMSAQAEKMLRGHREVGARHYQRTGAPPAALARWEGVAAWDTMRAALAVGERRAALASVLVLLRGRQRLVGLALALWSRLLSRRLSNRVARDGSATVAVLMREEAQRAAVIEQLRDRSFRDVSRSGVVRALLWLARRPAGLVIVGSRRQAMLLRVLGLPAVVAVPTWVQTARAPRPV